MSERVERGPLKLPRARRWTVYGVSFVTWITGVLWLIYHYFMDTEGQTYSASTTLPTPSS